MRKYLLILFCLLSFCVHSQTNIVELTQEQYSTLLDILSKFQLVEGSQFYIDSDGSIQYYYDSRSWSAWPDFIANNQIGLVQLLHMFFSGDLYGSYDSSANNILAYASSLHDHNADVRDLLSSIDSYLQSVAYNVGGFPSQFVRQYDITRVFHADYTNNFDKLYAAITNIDFNVSVSNLITVLQTSDANISNNLDGILRYMQDWRTTLQQDVMFVNDTINGNLNQHHTELMDFLHSLSNSALFASNLLDSCSYTNSFTNCCESIISILEWMTNNWQWYSGEAPYETNGWDNASNSTNLVWSVWHAESFGSDLLIPAVGWVEDFSTGNYRPYYATNQYDTAFNDIWQQYLALLDDYNANGHDGQKFLAGLVDLQLHIMANMSTQLYMIDSKLPSKTNLWEWIDEYKRIISDEVTQAEEENNEIVSSVSYLLDYTPFSVVGGHFPKVSNALNSLKVEQGSSPVMNIPIPRALRVSDSDTLVVDVSESEWFTTGGAWCRWIFTFIWGWLFIRLGLVPIFYIFFFTVRVAEISAHLVFMGSVRGSSGIVSSFGASAVDMVFSLLGIDTNFTRFVWGIMRD